MRGKSRQEDREGFIRRDRLHLSSSHHVIWMARYRGGTNASLKGLLGFPLYSGNLKLAIPQAELRRPTWTDV